MSLSVSAKSKQIIWLFEKNVNHKTTYSLALKNRMTRVKMTFLAKSMMKIKAA